MKGPNDGLDFGEGTDGIEPFAEFRRAGTSIEVAKQVDVHLDGREGIRRGNVVIREMRGKLIAESEKIR